MRAAFGPEVIGHTMHVLHDRTLRKYRPWVAEIVGRSNRYDHLDRRFLDGRNDYKDVNKRDTRGARRWFILESGHLYEAYYQTDWRVFVRHFLTVDDEGEIVEVEPDDVPGLMDRLFGPGPKRQTTVRRASRAR